MYEGNFAVGERHGFGVCWLETGSRCFEGIWSEDFPQMGTAVERDGTVYLATFDGATDVDNAAFEAKQGWIKVGRIHGWLEDAAVVALYGKFHAGEWDWDAAVELLDGSWVKAAMLGLRPYRFGVWGIPMAIDLDFARKKPTLAEVLNDMNRKRAYIHGKKEARLTQDQGKGIRARFSGFSTSHGT
jgi:hypothetical protein